jgi:hypothetical protein
MSNSSSMAAVRSSVGMERIPQAAADAPSSAGNAAIGVIVALYPCRRRRPLASQGLHGANRVSKHLLVTIRRDLSDTSRIFLITDP